MTFEAKDFIEMAVLLIGGVFSYARLQNQVSNNKEAMKDMRDTISDLDKALEKVKDRNDQFYNEVRAVTLGIQKSISRLEGKLGVNNRDD